MQGESPKVIWLEPPCGDANRETGRMWCENDVGPCEECGAHWIMYIRADGNGIRGERSMQDDLSAFKYPRGLSFKEFFKQRNGFEWGADENSPITTYILCRVDSMADFMDYLAKGADMAQEPLKQTEPNVNKSGPK